MKIIHPRSIVERICSKLGPWGIKMWHKIKYYLVRGRWPNFRHPSDISEHILSQMHKKEWLKYADYTDKWKVRDYIRQKGYGHLLLEEYGSWKDANDIDFEELPNKFALKPNNGSGGHFFCHDKSKIDISVVRKQLNEALNMIDHILDFHWEPHYFAIERRIYAEELMEMEDGSWPTDYKFTCIHGQIADCFICSERETGNTKYITLDTDWNVLPWTYDEYLPSRVPNKPKHLHEMLEIAKTLSEDFECVRVDLYEYKDKVYFSELTFSPWGGMMYSYNDLGIKELGKFFDK